MENNIPEDQSMPEDQSRENVMKRSSDSSFKQRSHKKTKKASNEKNDPRIMSKDQKKHKLVLQDKNLPDGVELFYISKGKALLKGSTNGRGILCDHCDKVVSATMFESHAGRSQSKKPFQHIYLVESENRLLEYASCIKLTSQKRAENNDLVCMFCQKSGELVFCNGCPSSFHKECMFDTIFPTKINFCKPCQSSMKRLVLDETVSGLKAIAVKDGAVSGPKVNNVKDGTVSRPKGKSKNDETVSGSKGKAVYDGTVSGPKGKALYDRMVSESKGKAVYDGTVSGPKGKAVYDRMVSESKGKAVYDGAVSGPKGKAVYDRMVSELKGKAVYDGTVSGPKGKAVYDRTVSGSKGKAVYDRTVSGSKGKAVCGRTVSGSKGKAVYDRTVSGSKGKAVYDRMVSGSKAIEETAEPGIQVDVPIRQVGCVLCRTFEYNEGGDNFNDLTAIVCEQCEKEHHIGCLKKHKNVVLTKVPDGAWYCSDDCKSLHRLIKFLIKSGSLAAEKWFMEIAKKKLKGCDVDTMRHADMRWFALSGKDACAEDKMLIRKAIGILHECFTPIIDVETKVDFIKTMAKGKKMGSSDFCGVYNALLTVNHEVVTAGLFRVFGRELVELPFVGTSPHNQGKGFFQAFMVCFERLLSFMKVKKIVLPAATDVKPMWIKKFGFTVVPPKKLAEYRQTYTSLMMFQGTTLLQKDVPQGQVRSL